MKERVRISNHSPRLYYQGETYTPLDNNQVVQGDGNDVVQVSEASVRISNKQKQPKVKKNVYSEEPPRDLWEEDRAIKVDGFLDYFIGLLSKVDSDDYTSSLLIAVATGYKQLKADAKTWSHFLDDPTDFCDRLGQKATGRSIEEKLVSDAAKALGVCLSFDGFTISD